MKIRIVVESVAVSVAIFFFWMTAIEEAPSQPMLPDFTEIFQKEEPKSDTKHQPTDQGFPRSTTA